MKTTCPKCGARGRLKSSRANITVRCPKCDTVFSVSNTEDGEVSNRRKVIRHRTVSLVVYLGFILGEAVFRDISLGGFGMFHPTSDADFSVDQTFQITIMRSGKPLMEALTARVVRRDNQSVGCVFDGLTDAQEERLKQIITEEKNILMHGVAKGSEMTFQNAENPVSVKFKGYTQK